MRKVSRLLHYIGLIALSVLLYACSAQRKLDRLKSGEAPSAQLTLGRQESFIPQIKNEQVSRDTLKIVDDDGSEILIMKAIKDEETGEMVASDVIDAAFVTARFRNIAERKGKVDLSFQVIVPASMRDSRWQLRFYPDMFVLGDSIRLEPVIITGDAYRRSQLKGYEQYERFLSRIIEDSTAFINIHQLEIFLKRNIPELYSFKSDSSYVSDDEFLSAYGVSEKQAIEHYTNKFARNMNERRKARKDRMYAKYVKAPIVTDGIRLDTVMVNSQGDFIYNYVQTLNSRPKLRRADIVLSGEIYEQDKKIYSVPSSEPLAFYISSIAAFVDERERYLTRVIERRASANTECRIDFEVGKADMRPELGENASAIANIEKTLASLLENDTFDLDSVVVSATASPEGSYASNDKLAQRRSEAVSAYFERYMRNCADSLTEAVGLSMSLEDTVMHRAKAVSTIKLTPRCIPENWADLHALVSSDVVMNVDQKENFFRHYKIANPDTREAKMKGEGYYKYMRETLYPSLRTVKFNFYLHRKGMVKDTVHTTVVDSTYMRGVQALKDMDYEVALALLKPYEDYNTAVAYMGMERNRNAMKILSKMEKTAQVNYLMAILYSREGDMENAVECYVRSCRQNPSYVYRGNLDPEISVLIKMYGLNQDDEYIDEY